MSDIKLDEHEQSLCKDDPIDNPIPDCIVIAAILILISAFMFLPMAIFGGE